MTFLFLLPGIALVFMLNRVQGTSQSSRTQKAPPVNRLSLTVLF